jgi:hypothetical protein
VSYPHSNLDLIRAVKSAAWNLTRAKGMEFRAMLEKYTNSPINLTNIEIKGLKSLTTNEDMILRADNVK